MTDANNQPAAMPPLSSSIRSIAPAGKSTDVDASIPLPGSIDWAAVDWDDLVPRLLLLAMSRLARMTWRGWRSQGGSMLPGAADAEDFVNEAIAKTMAGVRVWSPDACTLFQHLAGVVVSDISHAATAAENRLTVADDGRVGGWPPDRADDLPGQEQLALWRSEQQRLFDYLSGVDPLLSRLAELILVEDIDATSELVLRLGRPAADIANLRKRLKRAARAFLLAGQDGQRGGLT
jgi:hypothetical protein